MKGREVAVADKQFAAVGHGLEIDLGQDAADAIAAAQGQHHLHFGVPRGGIELRQTPRFGAAEALEFVRRVVVIMDGGALRLQAGDAARQCRFVGRVAAGRHDGDADFRSAQYSGSGQ